jgi:hypothetical protein
MFAKHPLTGKDIRIMNVDTSVWRDQKTLAWYESAPSATERLDRWDTGATSVAAAISLSAVGLPPEIVLCLGPEEACSSWCKAGNAAKAKIVAVPQKLVKHMGLESFGKMGLGNVVCLEELHEMYPFVGGAWDGSVEDAKLLLSLLFHFARTFPATNPSGRDLRGLRLQETMEIPQPLWLVTQYYRPQNSSRRVEIDACLQKNIACGVIDKIILLDETACAPPAPKVEEQVVGKRLTYADVIRWIYEKAPPNILVTFANADIFLDGPSWRALWSTDIETVPKFLALLRWDVTTADRTEDAKLFGPRADSQDTWVLSSTAVKAVTWDWAALEFPFGQGGCDNAITIELFRKKFLVANPALTMKTYHLHSSGIRSYDPRRVVEKPSFLYIQPTGLHDMKPVREISGTQLMSLAPIERRIKGPLTAAQARTFCTMVARTTNDTVQLDADGPNVWSSEPVRVSTLNDTFYTKDGLAYTYDTLLVGKSKASAEAWGASRVSYLAASLLVKQGIIAPLPDVVADSPQRYLLEYMSKVFLMRQRFGSASGEFWCSRKPECGELLRMFTWPTTEIPVISRDETQQAWCESAVMWPYQDTPPQYVSKEEIGALRGALGLGGWEAEVKKKQLIIVVDEKWITQDSAERIERELEGVLSVKLLWTSRTSLEASLRSLRGAWGLIVGKSDPLTAWCWVLPHGGFVWEVQSEMEPSAVTLHTAAAAELAHRLTIVPKGTPTEKDLVGLTTKLAGAILAECSIPTESVPSLLLPSGHSGFFAHAGDSFREICEEWGRRGYVTVQRSSSANIWLGGIGEILLYDRPTIEWLMHSPSREMKWTRALFGNPAPQGPKGLSWSFWPRRPLLVEDLVQKGLPLKPWEARTKTFVFYGKSENSVQKGHRTRHDWSTVCDDFVHIQGSEPYPYTHEQYLELLSNAWFGLCLAGYGFKCHREIECMAMGCVPICGPDVDMTRYAEPPVEGLHYLRAMDPAAAKDALEKITPDRWMVMSVACRDWWKRNCSVDGLWALTRRLIAAAPPSSA